MHVNLRKECINTHCVSGAVQVDVGWGANTDIIPALMELRKERRRKTSGFKSHTFENLKTVDA